MIITFLCILAIAFFVFSAYKKNLRKKSIRQCSYGSIEIYNLLLYSKDYSQLKKIISEAKTFSERYFISLSVSRLFPLKYLEDWVENEPGSADALLCYGARLLQWSWDARGYGRGFEVSDERWSLFFERLDKTRDVLSLCASRNSKDPTPWAYLIMVSTWYSDELEQREYYFDQAVARDQDNWAAHMHMVVALSEKWGGDNEEMIAFAEGTCEQAQEGSDLPIILLKAYIEYWKYLDIFADKSAEACQFIESAKIKTKAIDAYQKSLKSTNHIDSASSIFARAC